MSCSSDSSANLLKRLDYSVLQQCMHCGMCLPTCPTYVETKLERNSPRGRISLMRAVADGELPLTREIADEMYFCLGCLACTTSCPANVDYAQIFETARAEIERTGVIQTPKRRFWRWLTVEFLFMRPRLLRLVGAAMRVYQRSGIQRLLRSVGFLGLLPKDLKELEPMTPTISSAFSNALIQRVERPKGEVRARVGLLTGCVQDLAFSDINRDTVDVLLANGCEVFTPAVQPCCGSLHAHNGDQDRARELARKTIGLFPLGELDAVITNAGGCGSHLKHYGHLLADDPAFATLAREWDRKCKDIHEFLMDLGLRPPARGIEFPRATYHASCHLFHGQKVKDQPKQLLQSIPGLELVDLPEADWCCGSAGIYNITQPEQAGKLLERKIAHIRSTGARIIATANPGCHIQLQHGLDRAQTGCKVRHTVSLLAEAYRAGTAPS